MKIFYGSSLIRKETLEKNDIECPIKLEYYKEINKKQYNGKDTTQYGIIIKKKYYVENELKIEVKEIKYITNDKNEVNIILKIFKNNKVSTINAEEILGDIESEKITKEIITSISNKRRTLKNMQKKYICKYIFGKKLAKSFILD